MRTLIAKLEVGVTVQPPNRVKAQLYDTYDPLVLAVEASGHHVANPCREIGGAIGQMPQTEVDSVLGGFDSSAVRA